MIVFILYVVTISLSMYKIKELVNFFFFFHFIAKLSFNDIIYQIIFKQKY